MINSATAHEYNSLQLATPLMIVMMAKDGPPSVTVPTVPTVPTEEDMKAIRAVKDEDLPWIPPSPEVGPGEKLLTKMKENPFVPVGAFVGYLSAPNPIACSSV